jgi:hypothetical protein
MYDTTAGLKGVRLQMGLKHEPRTERTVLGAARLILAPKCGSASRSAAARAQGRHVPR